ncbi:MAG: DUF4169 family protein [Xanthobacteraceae bacterium]|jgi:hypothetical protein|nr:DUF4169 family protein [Xanthobacteraceae bacterium]
MAEIVNLRTARKRAERSKAEGRAADRNKLNQILDSHRIEPGDRR